MPHMPEKQKCSDRLNQIGGFSVLVAPLVLEFVTETDGGYSLNVDVDGNVIKMTRANW
jgi:hypothetical protein